MRGARRFRRGNSSRPEHIQGWEGACGSEPLYLPWGIPLTVSLATPLEAR